MEKILKVDRPKEKTWIKTNPSGNKYVFYRLRSYRNSKGKPTSDDVSIGKYIENEDKIIPNKNYFQYFGVENIKIEESKKEEIADIKHEVIKQKSVLHKLVPYLIKNTELINTLKQVFPNKYKDLLSLASYILFNGNIMANYEEFSLDNSFDITFCASQRVSDFFASIETSDIENFFEYWIGNNNSEEYIFYDVTSISTYSKNIEISDYGYNRDDEDLEQINLGMFYSHKQNLPLLYDIYNGSITDLTYFKYIFGKYKEKYKNNFSLVLDQGFVTKDNIEYIKDSGDKFVTLLPKSTKVYDKLINENLNDIKSIQYYCNDIKMNCKTVDMMYNNNVFKVHIYQSLEKELFDRTKFIELVENYEEKIKNVGKGVKLPKSYDKYFNIDLKATVELKYTKNFNLMDEYLSKLGMFILFTNDENISGVDTLIRYREKDVIEKMFDNLKNEMEFSRLRTHYTQTTTGKIFVSFIALIIRCIIRNTIKKNDVDNKFKNMEYVLKQLQTIKAEYRNNKYLVVPLTKKQKDVLNVLGIDLEKTLEE